MKYLIGGVMLLVILVIGSIIYALIAMYQAMPTMGEAVNFFNEAQQDIPALSEVIPAEVLPFPVGNEEAPSGGDVPTTLPDTPAAPGWLTPEQIAFLAAFGIDPADLPATLSPELELCLTTAVGAERFSEIKNGALPTMIEGAKAVGCLAL